MRLLSYCCRPEAIDVTRLMCAPCAGWIGVWVHLHEKNIIPKVQVLAKGRKPLAKAGSSCSVERLSKFGRWVCKHLYSVHS